MLENPKNMSRLKPHVIGFMNLLNKTTWDTNNNVVADSLKLMNQVFQADWAVLNKINIDDMVPMMIQKLGDTSTIIHADTISLFVTLN